MNACASPKTHPTPPHHTQQLPCPAPPTAMTLLRLTPAVAPLPPATTTSSTSTISTPLVNSLPHVGEDTLLDLHVAVCRQARAAHQRIRARRYQRYKARLALLGVPLGRSLERAALASASGGGGGPSPRTKGGAGV